MQRAVNTPEPFKKGHVGALPTLSAQDDSSSDDTWSTSKSERSAILLSCTILYPYSIAASVQRALTSEVIGRHDLRVILGDSYISITSPSDGDESGASPLSPALRTRLIVSDDFGSYPKKAGAPPDESTFYVGWQARLVRRVITFRNT